MLADGGVYPYRGRFAFLDRAVASRTGTLEAVRAQAKLNYQRTVIQAFREVADALAARRNLTELRQEQEGLVESLRQAVELAELRYRGGVASYLEYLDSERASFDAQLRLVQARLEELNIVIALYLALGGGWQ